MTKGKALVIDIIVTASLGIMLWALWNGAIRYFYTAVSIFGGIGFLSMSVWLYKWLTDDGNYIFNPVQVLTTGVQQFFGVKDEFEEDDNIDFAENSEHLYAKMRAELAENGES